MNDVVAPEVLVAGGGPVGLTLTIALARRGVRCLLVERDLNPLVLPKMELCNARTMEIYARLGLDRAIREAGYPAEASMDVIITESLQSDPIARLAYLSVAAQRELIDETTDGSQPSQPYQRISQYTLEPLLRAAAWRAPNVDARFGWQVESISCQKSGPEVAISDPEGRPQVIVPRYVVGCDGATSTVRKAMEIGLSGRGAVGRMFHVFFRADDLLDRHPLGIARHYVFAGGHNAALISQDDLCRWALHCPAVEGLDPQALITEAVGSPVPAEILHTGSWEPRLLVADRYGVGRVFLAGDSAHQMIPTGGFGLNTGIGDADNLAWKLAATLAGWGGSGLLDSYEEERRPVGERNVKASAFAAGGLAAWRGAYADGTRGDALRDLVMREQRKSHELRGVELAYRYDYSSIVCHEEPTSATDFFDYVPTAAPGARLPHLWLSEGESLHDRIGDGFSILRTRNGAPDPAPLAEALAHLGAPVSVLDHPDPHLRDVLGADLLLVRPDLHVTWRGDRLPDDLGLLADIAAGWVRRPEPGADPAPLSSSVATPSPT